MFSFGKSASKHKGRIVQRWVFEAKSPLLSSAAAVDLDGDGKKEIIFGTKDGKIFCITEENKEKWTYAISEKVDETESFFYDSERIDAVPATPTIKDVDDDGKPEVVFGTELGIVYCLSGAGKLVWEYRGKGAVRGRILVDDVDGDGSQEVLFGTTTGKFIILDHTGKQRFVFETQAAVEGEPAVIREGRTQVVFGNEKGIVFSYSPLGNLLWTFKADGSVKAKPVTGRLQGQDSILIGDTAGVLHCLDLNGVERWRFKSEGAIYGRATIADVNHDESPEVIFGSCDNKVYCLNARGERIWSYETDFWIVTSPIVTDIDGDGDLEVVVGSYDHNLYVLDGEGAYNLDYMPGLSGVAHQAGHYTSVATREAGEHVGKRLWQIKTQGMIVGCEELEKDNIIVNVKTGFVDDIKHENE